MTPEELAFQQGFLYPLYLILIGGTITGVLIPYFNRLHGQKLKEVDRKREDYRFELDVKERLIDRLSDESGWCFKKFKQIVKATAKDDGSNSSLQSDATDEEIMRDGQITNLIELYFKNKKLNELRNRLYGMIIHGLLLSSLPANSKIRKEQIEHFQKEFNITLTEKEVSDAVKEENGLFEPLFKISSASGMLYHSILESVVIIPHSKSSD